MSRERLLLLYCLLVGGAGWVWLTLTPQPATPLRALLLFGALALAVDTLSFRIPPTDAHSLGGVVIFTATLALGPAAGALVAATEGFLSGALLPFVYRRPRTTYLLVARPFLRGGIRAAAILGGAALAGLITGAPQLDPASLNPIALLVATIVSYAVLVQLGRFGREALQGGRSGVSTWWRSTWRLFLGVELLPLPLALLGAAIYTELSAGLFFLAGVALIAAAAVVRRATLNLQTQRRSVRELAQLNEVSRAIIRSELDVEALCELIYREASKIVDTSSFHLGLFRGDQYTLTVRVQDRVRMPQLSVNLEANDGIIGWIRQTGKALLVEDFAQEMARLPARPRYQSERPPRSGIYVPLIAGDDVIGSISVQSYQPAAFDANDLRLLSLIADQAAVAITRARAFNEARLRARQLQAIHEVSERVTAILNLDELLPSVVRLIREHFSYHPVQIFTTEPDDDRILFRASTATGEHLDRMLALPIRVGQGVVGSAVADAAPVLVGDVQRDPRYIRDSLSTRSELAVPLRIGEVVIGVLDVQSDTIDDFDADDLFVMRTLADQIAVAIDSANSYTAQQEEAWTLNALLQVAQNIGQASTLPDLLSTVVRLPPLLLGCDRCYCLLWQREDAAFALLAAHGVPAELRAKLVGTAFPLSEAPLLAHLVQTVNPDVPPAPEQLDAAQEHVAAWPGLIAAAGSGALIALPIVARGSLLGALILDFNRPGVRLNMRQAGLCTGTAAQVAGALESLLLAEEADEAARLDQELRVAREIQTALLPAHPPAIPGWQIDATWRSARLVGGDFYDFWRVRRKAEVRTQNPEPRIQNLEPRTGNPEPGTQHSALSSQLSALPPTLPGGPILHPAAEDPADRSAERPPGAGPASPLTPHPESLGLVIADVSDKGVPAAMFMAMSRSLVRAAALDGSAPATAMERANRWITRDSESGMFVTLFYALLETDSGRLCFTSAGHNPPLHFHAAAGRIDDLRTPGIALGVLEEIHLHEAEVTIAPGDVLVCYTDGVTEAIDEAEEEFGVERLRAIIANHRHESATTIMRAIIDAVDRHSHGQPPFDDVTLVVVKRESVETQDIASVREGEDVETG